MKIEFIADGVCRLDVALSAHCDVSRTRAAALIESGAVTLCGNVCRKSAQKVAVGDTVEVILPENVPLSVLPQDIPLDIVYQDADLAVINKQRNLTVHPANRQFENTLVNALLYHMRDLSGINGVLRPGIVHRLDKDTTGLLLVAKNDKAHQSLAAQIRDKTCRRIYVALLEGVLKEDTGVVDQPLARSRADRKKMAVDAGGKRAVTHFSVLKRFPNNTLALFELKTGRTHQIRVHAKYLGHPVVGDKKYGYKNQRFQLDGQLLHAWKIIFRHPSSGEEMSFSAPIPSDFLRILNILRKES